MKIKELFSNKDNWTQGYAAKDKHNHVCFLESPDACKFCLYGALVKCYSFSERLLIKEKVIEYLKDNNLLTTTYLFGIDAITDFNDNNTYEKVYNLVTELDI